MAAGIPRTLCKVRGRCAFIPPCRLDLGLFAPANNPTDDPQRRDIRRLPRVWPSFRIRLGPDAHREPMAFPSVAAGSAAQARQRSAGKRQTFMKLPRISKKK